MKAHKKLHPKSSINELKDLIIKNIENNLSKDGVNDNYQIFFYQLMSRLIIYFQPFDIKLPSLNQSNSKIKAYQIILDKTIADNFLKDIHINQRGVVVDTQIRKRLYNQFQIFKEMEKFT